jgi:hypothetical protein
LYGVLTVGSKYSDIKYNTVLSTPPTADNPFLRFIGICMDDVGSVTIAHNTISGYNIGLCVETNGANIYGNTVQQCCIGAFVDPKVTGAKLIGNTFQHTLPDCFNAQNNGAFLVAGVFIAGGINTLVKDNTIQNITAGGVPNLGGVGLAVDDDFAPPNGTGDVASGNVAKGNTIRYNDLDVAVGATGKGNVVKGNVCTSSLPTGIC